MIAVVLGLVIGFILRLIKFPGDILLRMLKSLVLPLIAASIIVGIASLSNSETSKRKLVVRTILYFLITTAIAVILGIVLYATIRPGSSVTTNSSQPVPTTTTITPLEAILGIFETMIPDNLVKAAYNLDILGVITFSTALGVVLVQMGPEGRPLLQFFESLNEAIMRIVGLVMCTKVLLQYFTGDWEAVVDPWYAPFGILSLICGNFAKNPDFWGVLSLLGMFAVTTVLGLVIQGFVILPLFYFALVRKNPFTYLGQMKEMMLTAIGTDSSAATLPISLKCVLKAGVSQQVAQLVLPLGVTLNMNGTALYEAGSALFIAQLNGVELSFASYIIVALTATLAAVGAAGIPEAGLVTMTMVLTAVGLPLDDIGLILTIDWFLDRIRTVVNCLGDAYGAAIVDHFEKKGRTYETIPD